MAGARAATDAQGLRADHVDDRGAGGGHRGGMQGPAGRTRLELLTNAHRMLVDNAGVAANSLELFMTEAGQALDGVDAAGVIAVQRYQLVAGRSAASRASRGAAACSDVEFVRSASRGPWSSRRSVPRQQARGPVAAPRRSSSRSTGWTSPRWRSCARSCCRPRCGSSTTLSRRRSPARSRSTSSRLRARPSRSCAGLQANQRRSCGSHPDDRGDPARHGHPAIAVISRRQAPRGERPGRRGRDAGLRCGDARPADRPAQPRLVQAPARDAGRHARRWRADRHRLHRFSTASRG